MKCDTEVSPFDEAICHIHGNFYAGYASCPTCAAQKRAVAEDAAPRWVRCSDRLPAKAGVYQRRAMKSFSDGRSWFSHWNGDFWGYVEYDAEGAMKYRHVKGSSQAGEWLDEAPAQEGQRQEAVLKPIRDDSAPAAQPAQSSMPPNYISQSQRRAQAVREVQTMGVAFRKEYGNGRRY